MATTNAGDRSPMSQLNFDGRQRLQVLQSRYGADRFQDLDPVTGHDSETGIALTVDAARRVVAAVVPDPSLVRTPAQLRRGVRAAFADADLVRARASRAASGAPMPQGDQIEISSLLARPTTDRRGIAQRTRAAVLSGVPAGTTSSALAGVGRSGNGYLSVTIGPTGVVEDLDADPDWLAAASAHYLEAALVQAFHEACQPRDGEDR